MTINVAVAVYPLSVKDKVLDVYRLENGKETLLTTIHPGEWNTNHVLWDGSDIILRERKVECAP